MSFYGKSASKILNSEIILKNFPLLSLVFSLNSNPRVSEQIFKVRILGMSFYGKSASKILNSEIILKNFPPLRLVFSLNSNPRISEQIF